MLNEKEQLLLSKLRVQRFLCFVVALVALLLSMGEMISFNPPVRGSGEVSVPHLLSLNEEPTVLLYCCMVTMMLCLFVIVKTTKTIDGLLKTKSESSTR
jgi:hypothetical protein